MLNSKYEIGALVSYLQFLINSNYWFNIHSISRTLVSHKEQSGMLFNLTGALLKRENNNQTRWVWGVVAVSSSEVQR